MKRITPLLLVGFVSSFAAACSSGSLDGGSNRDGGGALSCDNRSIESTCADYPSGTLDADARSSCDGTVVAAPCPSADVVGTCRVSVPNGILTNVYYDDGPKPWTIDTSRTACNGRGVFTAN